MTNERYGIGLEITQHCAERYVERVIGIESKLDITTYIEQHKEKIENDINKMFTYGDLIYTGKLGPNKKDREVVNVILNGSYVILTTETNTKVITLYKIDLGVDDEFNKIFIDKMKCKIQKIRNDIKEEKENTKIEKEKYLKMLNECNAQISEYENIIKKLTDLKNGYKEVIDSINIKNESIETKLKNYVEKMIYENNKFW